MSKEMTPKESLEFIIDTFNKLAQKPQDIGLMFKFCEAHEKINQALDRLELFEKENQELKNKNAALKIKVRAWEIQGKKYKKVIDILKEKADIRLHSLNNTDGSKIYEIEFILGYYSTIYDITKQEYDLLKEFLE